MAVDVFPLADTLVGCGGVPLAADWVRQGIAREQEGGRRNQMSNCCEAALQLTKL